MKRLLFFIVSLSLVTFVGCDKSNNNDNPFGNGNYSININGVSYKVSTMIGSAGGWNEEYESGGFTLSVLEEHNEGNYVIEYNFFFSSKRMPQVGDNFATMDLCMEGIYSYNDMYYHQSGSASITSINSNGSEMIVKFSNLKMVNNDGNSYTFDGTAPIPFDFYPER